MKIYKYILKLNQYNFFYQEMIILSNNNQLDVGQDIIKFHKIITRGIKIAYQHTNESLETGILDASTQEGFLKFVQTFSSVLKAHHMAEDEVIFPYVRDLIPEAPYERLIEEHTVLSAELYKINNAINDLRSEGDALKFLRLLDSALGKIDELWHPHIKIEESVIYERIGSMISLEEMIKFKKDFIQNYQKNVEAPDYLLAPFSIYNLSPDDRGLIEQQLPEIVTKQLIPIDWKDKWAPMKPFLLK